MPEESIPRRKGNRTTHGRSGTRLHNIWLGMKSRCCDPNQPFYKDYGGRGITVCERWLHSFENFAADVGECPPGMTLDRWPDNNGNYEKANVRWASRKEQANNRRLRSDARLITFLGETKHLREWSRDPRVIALGISEKTLSSRLFHGWSEEETLSTPYSLKNTDLTFEGQTRTLKQWSALTGVSRDNLYQRIFIYKWAVKRALTTQ